MCHGLRAVPTVTALQLTKDMARIITVRKMREGGACVFERCCTFSSFWEVGVPDNNKYWSSHYTHPSACDCQTL